MSRWKEKREAEKVYQIERELNLKYFEEQKKAETTLVKDTTGAAMGEGEEELFERKLTKEEKKALAKKKREAKKKKSKKDDDDDEQNNDGNNNQGSKIVVREILQQDGTTTADADAAAADDGLDHEQADKLAAEGTICTFATSRKGVDARSRDISVQNFTLQHKGTVLLDETEIVLNHGNRYGLVGRNGCGT
jgi:ATP-binding cassette subfamily F protein 2